MCIRDRLKSIWAPARGCPSRVTQPTTFPSARPSGAVWRRGASSPQPARLATSVSTTGVISSRNEKRAIEKCSEVASWDDTSSGSSSTRHHRWGRWGTGMTNQRRRARAACDPCPAVTVFIHLRCCDEIRSLERVRNLDRFTSFDGRQRVGQASVGRFVDECAATISEENVASAVVTAAGAPRVGTT